MAIIWAAIKMLLETLFFLGMAGSLIVVVLTLIEDVGIFKKGEDEKVKQTSHRPVGEHSELQQPRHLGEHLRGTGVL